MGATGADVVVVTVGDAVVDGLVDVAAVAEAAPTAPVTSVADPAPPTVRPSLATRDLVDRLRQEPEARFTVVTTAAGALVGVVGREALLGLARDDRLP